MKWYYVKNVPAISHRYRNISHYIEAKATYVIQMSYSKMLFGCATSVLSSLGFGVFLVDKLAFATSSNTAFFAIISGRFRIRQNAIGKDAAFTDKGFRQGLITLVPDLHGSFISCDVFAFHFVGSCSVVVDLLWDDVGRRWEKKLQCWLLIHLDDLRCLIR